MRAPRSARGPPRLGARAPAHLGRPADPLLYERLVKAFQTAAERQSERREMGFGRILESDFARAAQRDARRARVGTRRADGVDDAEPAASTAAAAAAADADDDAPWGGRLVDREHGRRLWREFLTERFVRGRDDEFDYGPVDADAALDVVAQREAQEAWFDEEPGWASGADDGDGDEQALRERRGETGVWDY